MSRLLSGSNCCASTEAKAIAWALALRVSDALIDQPGEQGGRDEELAPFRVELFGWLGRDGLIERAARALEHCYLLPDGGEHVAIGDQLVLVAHGTGTVGQVVAGDDDGF